MKLILKKDEDILLSTEIELDTFDNIIFGTERVKEVSFIKDIINSDQSKLEPLYNKLISIPNYMDCNNLIVFYDKDHYFHYNIPVKNIYYRVLSYMRERHLVMQENLSIRFEEDNQPKFDFLNNIAICDKRHCAYFKDNHCEKYNTKLEKYYNDYVICKNCYLEMWPALGKQFREHMETLYDNTEGGK